jgi:phosphatidate cytidylyltransferase
MNLRVDQQTLWLGGGVVLLLSVASLVGFVLARMKGEGPGAAAIANLNARIRAWWVMVVVFGLALLTGGVGSVILFALLSFLALREFITLTPTEPADHRALFWLFFLLLPAQYGFILARWYGMFSIFLPVYAFLFLPIRAALAGDTTRFLERAAKIQWAAMVCIYCVSHAPALLMLQIQGYEGQNAKLLFFLVAVVQMSDVLQYVFGKLWGRRKIAPTVSPNKTAEGFVGGCATATLCGALLWRITPFSLPGAAAMALAITVMGFCGGLVMSAIKRDRGVKDFGASIPGHGGVLDRIDSICFAAPIFFHLTRWFAAG